MSIRSVIVFAILAQVFGFAPSAQSRVSTSLNARSKSVPFLDQPVGLDGKMPGDVGFDPLNISGNWMDVSS